MWLSFWTIDLQLPLGQQYKKRTICYPASRRICPPPLRIFAVTPKPLQISTRNWGYLILHQFDIDCASFLEILLKMFAKKMRLCDVTTSHFWYKSSKCSEIHQKSNFEANRHKSQQACQTTSATKWLSRTFKILSFWSQNYFFRKNL